MRKLLSLIVVPLLVLSCKKETSTLRPDLPKFTCDNDEDDGRFEAWDAAERSLLLYTGGRTTYNIRDTMAAGYIKKIEGITIILSASLREYTFRVVYDTGRIWYWKFQLVDNTTGNIEAYSSIYKRGASPMGDTVIEKIKLNSGAGITMGCKRLYYYGAILTHHGAPPPTTQQTLTDDYNMDILFKGHYDLTVR